MSTEKKKSTVFFFCSEEEKALIKKASHRAEMSQSEFCIKTLIERAKKLLGLGD